MFWTKNKLCFPWTCGSCVWFPDQHKACTFPLWCSCDNSMLCNYSRLISSRTQLEHELQLEGDIYAHYNSKHVQIKDIYSLSALLYWSKWSMEKAVCIWCHILMRYREIQKSKEDRLMSTVKNVLCQIQFLMVKQKKMTWHYKVKKKHSRGARNWKNEVLNGINVKTKHTTGKTSNTSKPTRVKLMKMKKKKHLLIPASQTRANVTLLLLKHCQFNNLWLFDCWLDN